MHLISQYDRFLKFDMYRVEKIKSASVRSKTNVCSLNPIPAKLIIQFMDCLSPFFCLRINSPCKTKISQSSVIITPPRKKNGLDKNENIYIHISNLQLLQTSSADSSVESYILPWTLATNSVSLQARFVYENSSRKGILTSKKTNQIKSSKCLEGALKQIVEHNYLNKKRS
ncbi:hypothetical protein HELRODRAFT_162921 [Helobdella robusta]|uniref:Uncharacterized protein n=1 Tax=Helobdella robusta TaxID=6412 RepID=T1ETD1_HELRO|nr:hypothetical protein HELRODRAFT_162921 [Helobdella robusta]ESN99379.1 hypothetical protein HELRODRAFT_162921 [Helobdella robusta]